MQETIDELKASKKRTIEYKAKNELTTKFKIRTFAFFIIVSVFAGFYYFGNIFFDIQYNDKSILPHSAQEEVNEPKATSKSSAYTPDKTIPTKTYSKQEIKALISNYSVEHNISISEWRQGQIIKSFANAKFSNWQAKNQISKIINKEF